MLETWVLIQRMSEIRSRCAELLASARIEADYSALDEPAKRALLLRQLNDARPLRLPAARYSDHTVDELRIFETVRSGRARFSGEPPNSSSRRLLRGERNSCSR